MEDWREAARDHVRNRVWSGDYDEADVFEVVVNFDMADLVFSGVLGSDKEENRAWLRDLIQGEFRAKLDAERGWPEVTDCDRLEQVVEVLRNRDILADELACGFTIQDGWGIMNGLYEEEGGEKSGIVGCCFFHMQDMERAIWTDIGLFLAFGSFAESEEEDVRVGRLVREECERVGFIVDWDGTADSRLLLKGFRWQRRSP